MTRTFAVIAVLSLALLGGVLAYQAAARDRQYRALLARGDAALLQDQTFGAIEAYSGAIALRPDAMLAHLRRGETYQRRGDLDNAARDFRRAAELDPSATRPLEALGDVLYERDRFANAAEAYGARLQLDDQSVAIIYKLALARYREGDLDGALAAIDDAIGLEDEHADVHYLQGLTLLERQELPGALAALERAVALAPGLVPAREELADLYGRMGRPSDQLEQLQVVAGLDRDRVERHVAVGLAQARAGKMDLAVLTLGAVLERTPDHPRVYEALGRVWLEIALTREDRPDALPKALEALERLAGTPEAPGSALTLYGRALLLARRPGDAERVLQQAIRRFPIDPEALLAYADAAEQQGHWSAARTALLDYGVLVSPEPEFAARAARIAALSLRLNEAAAGVAWLTRAVAWKPDDVELLAALADAQLRAGDTDGARRTVASGLEYEPNDPALQALADRTR
jgi:tetratricopeptide (TPR) repeat protein